MTYELYNIMVGMYIIHLGMYARIGCKRDSVGTLRYR